MKTITRALSDAGVICRRLERFDPARIGSRRRIAIYEGVDTENRYVLLFHIARKSRILRADAESLLAMRRQIEAAVGHPFRQVFLLPEAPLCSKAAARLKEEGWRILPTG